MPKTHIAKDLRALRKQSRELEQVHSELFKSTFSEHKLARLEGMAMIVKSGQHLLTLYRQERALAKLVM